MINTISKSKMVLRRLGGGNEAYCIYVEEDDNDANKNSSLIGSAFPLGERIINRTLHCQNFHQHGENFL